MSSEQLGGIIEEIVTRCPEAYKETGEDRGQILVDNMDLIFFNEITLTVRQILGEGMSV